MNSIPAPIATQYRTLGDNLLELKNQCRTQTADAIALHSRIQSQFEALLAATLPPLRQQLQRYNTEIFKQIQLLGPDLMRLQLLKPGNKQEAVCNRIDERCDRLQDYISSLLNSNCSS